MRKVTLASALVIVVAAQALGASTVGFELELGGNNNGARCEAYYDAVNRPAMFTDGNPADDQVYNGVITWDVKVDASGTDADGQAIRGVANFVFDLALYVDSVAPENLVALADFTSTANDGTAPCPDVLPAAFAFGFEITAFSRGPGRVMDPLGVTGINDDLDGGPRMDVHTYPTEPNDGTLLGMGAGYSSWERQNGFGVFTTAGVGMTSGGDPSIGPMGRGPVCEGQISGLTEGNYILVLTPGGGINVLRSAGYVDLTKNADAFAVAADTTVGDQISFTVGGSPCQIDQWASVRTHSTVELPIILDPTPETGTGVIVEPRQGGVQKIVVDFNRDVTDSYVSGAVSIVPALTVVSEALLNAGTTLEIEVDGSTDGVCYTIDLANSVTCLEGDTDCKLPCLYGDVNNSHTTNLIDAGALKSASGTPGVDVPVGYDVNLSNSVNLLDFAVVKVLSGTVSCN